MPVAAAITGLAVYAGATELGQNVRVTGPVDRAVDQLAARFGLGVTQIELSGFRYLDPKRALDVIASQGEQSVIGFGYGKTRQALLDLAWIKSAEIKRVWPDRLIIRVVEREPVALWLKDGGAADVARRAMLIDARGAPLSTAVPSPLLNMPLIAGAGANQSASELFKAVASVRGLSPRIRLHEFVGARRWTLHLRNGAQILLPESGIGDALGALDRARLLERLRGADQVDLRTAGRVVLRQRLRRTAEAERANAAVGNQAALSHVSRAAGR